MKPSKSIPLAITVVIIAVASIIAPIAITESWFSDEESADITISVSVLKIEKTLIDNTTETYYWNGTDTYELFPGIYDISPSISGSTVTVYIDNPNNCTISELPVNSQIEIKNSVTLNVTGTVKISLSQEAFNQAS